jgi:hypothetical protein
MPSGVQARSILTGSLMWTSAGPIYCVCHPRIRSKWVIGLRFKWTHHSGENYIRYARGFSPILRGLNWISLTGAHLLLKFDL